MEFLFNLKHFCFKFFQPMENAFFWLVATLAYLLGYPAEKSILIFALALFILDIVTRFNAIRVQEKGLWKAFMNGKISSRAFWNGFVTKSVSYFTILVMGNLCKTTPQLGFVGTGISTIFYVGLAFYEMVSNMENLRDAGITIAIPFLNKLKKEQDKFFESENDNKG
jgi:phage-related holin